MSTTSLVVEGTTHSANNRILRRALSFPVMMGSLLVVLGVLTVRSRFDDPDMWWHLKMGEIIWTTHTIPTTDLFSYTTNHHSWIPHEWLSQTLIYGAYRFAGYSGLMLWLCFLTAALLVGGYILCSVYSGNVKVGFAGGLLLWSFATIGLAVRPQMMGYLLLTIELLLLHLGRTRNPRWFFGLPPLFALWVNCHGSFFLGFVIAGAILFCSFFDFRRGLLVASRWESRRRNILMAALVLSMAALFLNPLGMKQILYPVDTLVNQPISLSVVEEWMPLEFSDGRAFEFLVVSGCIFLLVIARRSELFLDELMVLALAIYLAASHRRMLFVFGILAAPILSRLLSTCWDGYDPEHDRPIANAIFIAGAVLIVFLRFPDRHNLTRQVAEHSPVKAVEFIQTHHISGRMLNEYIYGGYLIWAAPEHPVFVDGRGDVFEWTGVLGDLARWATLQSDPNVLLNKYRIDFCLLSRGSPMARVLALLPDWRPVYSDDQSVIVMRTPVTSPAR